MPEQCKCRLVGIGVGSKSALGAQGSLPLVQASIRDLHRAIACVQAMATHTSGAANETVRLMSGELPSTKCSTSAATLEAKK
eukprot:scaffold4937_cov30-Tisochrysis_lutea.AAC.3